MVARDTALMDRLLFDSTLIHGDWSLHHETDTAVLAGTIRLVGQRRMPAAGATRGLDAAWATKQEVDAFIEQRTSEGRSPSQLAHSLFRAFSARLAVLRADASIALQEAHLAQLLSVWEPVTALARGVEALARAMAFDGPAASPDDESLDDQPSEIATLGLTGMGAAFQILATGFAALVRLDRAELDLALSRVSNAAAEVAGLWSVRMALMALRDAVWGSPAEALTHLLAEFANRPPMTNEQNEPLGRSVLGRARVLLLTQTGALAAVQPVLSDMPPAVRAVAVARTALWAGHLGEAVRSAEAGLLQTDLRPADRSRLAIIGAAAALLQGPVTPATKDRAVLAVDELVTGMRREGVYAGLLTFMRKLSSALAIFLISQAIALAGYVPPVSETIDGVTKLVQQPQSPEFLVVLRAVFAAVPILLLVCCLYFALRFPLTPRLHARLKEFLARRRAGETGADLDAEEKYLKDALV